MILSEWGKEWGIPYQALNDLRIRFGSASTEPRTETPGLSEAAVQNQIRLEAAEVGARIWRNNVGAMMDENGHFIRFGLCNDSAQMNREIKSSDLIGIKPVLITPAHVGSVLGVFLAREVKPGNWFFTGTDRERGQLKFLELVAALGGDARFVTGRGSL